MLASMFVFLQAPTRLWAAALVLTVLFAPAAVTMAQSSDTTPSVVDVQWQWTVTNGATDDDRSINVDDPSRYTLMFLSDGTFQIRADCNLAAGGYSLDGTTINLSVGPMTLAQCPPESLADRYLASLGGVTSIVFDGNNLLMSMDDGGQMVFAPAPSGTGGAGADSDAPSPGV
jgi:heat shock protein HslJ